MWLANPFAAPAERAQLRDAEVISVAALTGKKSEIMSSI
jgi:hypothetical protein